jgi:1-aminocyclopropane-1-carboxylate deaminase/D-cysteine desulfhydrase-like pyridoxal-dependent ACC family enzyme
VIAAIRKVAKLEGILLDPVYTGKCMSGLLDQIEKGQLTQDDCVVFLHSGGVPSLFQQYKTLST